MSTFKLWHIFEWISDIFLEMSEFNLWRLQMSEIHSKICRNSKADIWLELDQFFPPDFMPDYATLIISYHDVVWTKTKSVTSKTNVFISTFDEHFNELYTKKNRVCVRSISEEIYFELKIQVFLLMNFICILTLKTNPSKLSRAFQEVEHALHFQWNEINHSYSFYLDIHVLTFIYSYYIFNFI